MAQERPGSDVEGSFKGELDFPKRYKNCEKNRGHQKFRLVDQFNMNDLPDGYHDNDLLNMTRTVSDLTVCLSVNFISEKRPETFPGTDTHFPFYRSRGRNMVTKGTGWVNRVDIFKKTVNSQTQKAQIHIHTAAHVVYDDIEGAHTTCYLFFNRGGTPDACNGVIALSGMIRVESNPENDRCDMIHETDNLELAEKMSKLVDEWKRLRHIIETRYLNLPCDVDMALPKSEHVPKISQHTLTILVSHIHGCSKRVSVGNCINLHEQGDWIQYKYTTATCPGSSGALVFVMGRKRYDSSNWYFSLVHSAGWTDYNFSGQTFVNNIQGENTININQFKQDRDRNKQCWCVHINKQTTQL